MKEERVILKIADLGDGVVSTECEGHGVEDFGKIITSVMLLCKENRLFNLMLMEGIINLHENKKFNEELEKSSINCPDFNDLLKNND